MKRLFIVFLAATASSLFVNLAFAAGANSPQELASSVRQAIADKNSAAISALYSWQGVDSDIRPQLEEAIEYMLDEPVRKAEVRPVPDDFQGIQTMGDQRFKQNLPVEGVVVLIYSLEDDSIMASMPYGAKDGKYYFTAPVIE